MGYYSTFEVIDTDFDLVELREILEDNTNYTFYLDCGTLQSTGEYKWYGWKDDLATITKMYPGKFLEIERIGEESPDMERVRAKDGNIQSVTPEIVWPNY